MVISISRRSDILSYHPDFLEKIFKEGYLEIENPFNPKQKKRVSLLRKDVTALVFWTRNAIPSLPLLRKLEKENYPFYLMISYTAYPKILEPNAPDFETAHKNFSELSRLFSQDRVVLRYDPIVFSNITDEKFHLKNFEEIAKRFHRYTKRVIVSLFDPYKLAVKRMEKIEELKLLNLKEEQTLEVLSKIKEISERYCLEIQSCCEGEVFQKAGIKKGACIDFELLNKLFSLEIKYEKDKNQRKECLCQKSVDIGKYNTCLSNCLYCYANRGKN